MKLTETQRTALWVGGAVGAAVLAALVHWLTKRRADRALLGLGASGNIVAAAVQTVIDKTNEIMGNSYFTIDELTRSSKAQKLGIDNTPPAAILAKLQTLITQCLDPIRRIYGRPIIVSSGYRCPALNKAVGGSGTSQHMEGEAADLVPASGGSLKGIFRAAVQWGGYDQLIIEQSGSSRWVHVSYGPRNRRTILAYRNGAYQNITHSWETYIENLA